MRYRIHLPTPIAMGLIITLTLSPPGWAAAYTVRVASGLSRPVFVTSPRGDLHRLFAHQEHPTIGLSVPAVHEVVGPPPKDPDRQVQAEGRYRLEVQEQ